jgi:hypothetical protein
MNIRDVSCPHCHSMRDQDLKTPCRLCGSKQYSIIGYNYPHEAKQIRRMLIVIGIMLLVAFVFGLVVFIYLNLQLQV